MISSPTDDITITNDTNIRQTNSLVHTKIKPKLSVTHERSESTNHKRRVDTLENIETVMAVLVTIFLQLFVSKVFSNVDKRVFYHFFTVIALFYV